jgi:hypothetical protein
MKSESVSLIKERLFFLTGKNINYRRKITFCIYVKLLLLILEIIKTSVPNAMLHLFLCSSLKYRILKESFKPVTRHCSLNSWQQLRHVEERSLMLVISGFCRDVNEICALLAFCAVLNSSSMAVFD